MSLPTLLSNSTLPTLAAAAAEPSETRNPAKPAPADLFWCILVSAVVLYCMAVISDGLYKRGKEQKERKRQAQRVWNHAGGAPIAIGDLEAQRSNAGSAAARIGGGSAESLGDGGTGTPPPAYCP